MTRCDLLPRTPAHQVLMHVAFGAHQVANVAAEVEARTIGSAFVYWDSGTATPPNGNVPAVNGAGAAGHDPHEDPRATYAARVQKSAFLQPGGLVIDVCGGKPCLGRPFGPEDAPK